MKRVFLSLVLAGIFLIPAVVCSAKDPVLILTFDEIDKDIVKDLSKFGNNGTLQNNPKVVNGKFGKALEFESSRVRVAASDSLGTEIFKEGKFTLSLWINAKLTGNQWQQIFRAGPDPNDTLFINVDGRLSWRGWVGAAWAGGMCETAGALITKEKWAHAAVVSDSKVFQVYIDGELARESPFQATRGNNREYMIGGYAGGESYSGAVDDLAIFPEPLDKAKINSIMSKGLKAGLSVDSREKVAVMWGYVKSRF